jgi:hypothetical protein
MKIILAIPSGQRTEKLINCILKWRKVCDFKIAVYTWDEDTQKDVSCMTDELYFGQFRSFACNHNFLARTLQDWDVYICGADDLYPAYGIGSIELVCSEYPEKVIWVKDGFLNQQPTHAIITRGWYDKYGSIYDERFKHNFCDTDLLARTINANEIVKCFDIGCDHRHYLRMDKKKDEIYRIGESSFAEDKKRFEAKYQDDPLTNGKVEGVTEVKIEGGIVVPA